MKLNRKVIAFLALAGASLLLASCDPYYVDGYYPTGRVVVDHPVVHRPVIHHYPRIREPIIHRVARHHIVHHRIRRPVRSRKVCRKKCWDARKPYYRSRRHWENHKQRYCRVVCRTVKR